MTSVDSRFIDLETRLTFLEKGLEDLNQTVLEQSRQLLELRRAVEEVVIQLAPSSAEGAAEKRPHDEL